jgi:beta-galactosidase
MSSFVSVSTPTAPETSRPPVDLDRDWTFQLFPGRLAAWLGRGGAPARPVDVPHCWNEGETFRYGHSYTKGVGVYRREIRAPGLRHCGTVAGKGRWILEAEGFYGLADILLDGRILARRLDASYLGFAVELGEAFETAGHGRLEIRTTNRCPPWVLPGTPRRDPDFVLYGGLAGHVRLRRRPALRLDGDAIRIRGCDVLGARPRVEMGFRVVNGSSRRCRCRVRWTVRDADGEGTVRAEDERDLGSLASGEARDGELTLVIASPRLWSDREPHLYVAEGRLFLEGAAEDGDEADACRRSFGLRTAELRPDEGFFLNGERVELRGANRHQSMPGFGNALPDEQHREDAELLRATGLNFVRLAHYPQHPLFLDACDRLGLMTYPEIATWKSVRGGRWLRSARRQMRALILRDRHRPSVILWGMGNESRHRRAYLELRQIASELDPDRPVIYAENHLYRARRQRTVGIPDVWGVNYELDVLGEGRASSRLRNVVVSECMNHPRAVRGSWGEERAQLDVLERDRAILRADPAVAGFAIWAFADYATEHAARYRRLPGLYDAWRQPKMAAALFRAWFVDQPVLEIFGDWGERPPGEPDGERTVHVITNCRNVVLSLAGRTLAQWPEGPRHEVALEPAPGTVIEARGELGERVVVASLPWHGAARRIRLVPEAATIDAGSRATVGFAVRIEDAEGHLVVAWNGLVRVELDGPARLRAFAPGGVVEVSRGTGRGFLTAAGEKGEVRLRAVADGLGGPPTTIRAS